MIDKEDKLSVKEKIGYSLEDLAANPVFQTLMTYLAYFYTDIYWLNTNHASPIILTAGFVAAFGFNRIIGAFADRKVSGAGNSGHGYYLWRSGKSGTMTYRRLQKFPKMGCYLANMDSH